MTLDLNQCDQACFGCIKKYKTKHQLTKGQSFDVACKGIPKDFIPLEVLASLQPAQHASAVAMMDPVSWAADTLDWHCFDPDGEIWKRKNPDEYTEWVRDNPGKSLLGHSRYHRPYQGEILRCTSKRKVARIGRQAGKTDALVVGALFHMFTKPGVPENEGFKIIIITPYQAQIEVIFNRIMQLLQSSPITQNSLKRNVKAPIYTIELMNGSTIRGFTAGTKSGGNAGSVRGQTGNMLMFDEADYLSGGDVDSALSIITNHPNATVWMSSTPSGKREKFYGICNSKTWKEFHYPSSVNPMYSKQQDQMFKESLTEIGYKHEVLAEFGEQEEGVFQNVYVQAARKDYKYGSVAYNPTWKYTVGVDWNDTKNGTTIAILGLDPYRNKFVLVDRHIVSRDGWTQLMACEKIAEINRLWKPIAIYLDAGYGGCVDGNTLIQTPTGVQLLSEIKIGNYVLTDTGEYRVIQDKIKSLPKECISIKASKTLPIEVTLDHPLLTLETQRGFRDKNIGKPIWKSAKDLKINKDFIAIPKEQIPCLLDTRIDLTKYLPNLEFNEDTIWNKHTNKSKPTFRRYLDLSDKEFQLLLGWYISEGSASKNEVEISQKVQMSDFAEVIDIARKFFSSVKVIENNDGLKRLIIVGKIAEQVFTFFGGKGCSGKRIYPDFLKIGCSSLIKGILLGDGHITKQKASQIQLSLTSFDVITQLRQYFINHGILPNLYFVKRRKSHHKDQLRIDLAGNEENLNKISLLTGFSLQNPKRINRRQYLESENYLFVPVRKIKKIGQNTNLFDLSVEGTNCFVGNGVLLHNTQYEVLRKFGFDSLRDPTKGPLHQDSKLPHVLKQYDFGSKVDTRDIFTGQPTSKEAKPFLVESTVRRFEAQDLEIPFTDLDLEQQLLGYIIDRITPTGRPVYKASSHETGDHLLDAVMLSIMAFVLEATPLGKAKFETNISFSGQFGEKLEPEAYEGDTIIKPDLQHKREQAKEGHRPSSSRALPGTEDQLSLFKSKQDLPASNTNKGSAVGIWSWNGFLRDEPKPQSRSLSQAENDARKRIGIAQIRFGKPKRKNI